MGLCGLGERFGILSGGKPLEVRGCVEQTDWLWLQMENGLAGEEARVETGRPVKRGKTRR